MSDRPAVETLKVAGEELLRTIRELVHQGNVRRIIVKNEAGQTYIEIPLALGLVGAILAPVWAAVGALAALATGFTIEVQRADEGKDGGGAGEGSDETGGDGDTPAH